MYLILRILSFRVLEYCKVPRIINGRWCYVIVYLVIYLFISLNTLGGKRHCESNLTVFSDSAVYTSLNYQVSVYMYKLKINQIMSHSRCATTTQNEHVNRNGMGVKSPVFFLAWWPHGKCARLRIERFRFEPWPGTLCCVLGQDT